jgi:hypothetical protein
VRGRERGENERNPKSLYIYWGRDVGLRWAFLIASGLSHINTGEGSASENGLHFWRHPTFMYMTFYIKNFYLESEI